MTDIDERRFVEAIHCQGRTYRVDGFLFRRLVRTDASYDYTPWQTGEHVAMLPLIVPPAPDAVTRLWILSAFLDRANGVEDWAPRSEESRTALCL